MNVCIDPSPLFDLERFGVLVNSVLCQRNSIKDLQVITDIQAHEGQTRRFRTRTIEPDMEVPVTAHRESALLDTPHILDEWSAQLECDKRVGWRH